MKKLTLSISLAAAFLIAGNSNAAILGKHALGIKKVPIVGPCTSGPMEENCAIQNRHAVGVKAENLKMHTTKGGTLAKGINLNQKF